MPLQITSTQEFDVAVDLRDKRGNPAPCDNPVLSSSDESVLVIVPGEDPYHATARAVGGVGAAMVKFQGDADLGDGVVPILATLDVVVVAGQAVVATVAAGAPREQVVEEPAPVEPAPPDA